MTLPLIFPPASLPRFLADGHGVDLGRNYAGVSRGRGHSRLRAFHTGAPRTVTVSLDLSAAQMAAFEDWFENALAVGTLHFTAEVANLGPGQLFWDAVWVAMPEKTARASITGTRWTVTGSLTLSGLGYTSRPSTGVLIGEVLVALLGAAALTLPPVPLAGEVIVALTVRTDLSGEVVVPLLPTQTLLAGEVFVMLDGSGAVSPGGSGGGTHYLLPVSNGDEVNPSIVFYEGEAVYSIEDIFA